MTIATIDKSNAASVIDYLSQARDWLATCVELTGPETIALAKAEIATAAEATRQLGLSREIRLDAEEMERRAEYALGKSIRKGQADGTIRTPGQRDGNQYTARNEAGVDNTSTKRHPHDFASKNDLSGNGAGIYQLSDDVEPEQFDAAIEEAKTEGNLSRANVVRKVRGEKPKAAERPEILRGTRRIDPNRVIEATVLDASNVVSPSLIAQIDFADLDRERLGEWINSLTESTAALRKLRKSLEKELRHG